MATGRIPGSVDPAITGELPEERPARIAGVGQVEPDGRARHSRYERRMPACVSGVVPRRSRIARRRPRVRCGRFGDRMPMAQEAAAP